MKITENELSLSVRKKLNISLLRYNINVSSNFWKVEDDGIYYYNISHKLGINEDDIVDIRFIDSDTNEEVFITYKIIDENTLNIYSINSCDGKLTIKYQKEWKK